MGHARSVSFLVLTSRSLCRLQEVSVPRPVVTFRVLTSPPLCRLQEVSSPCSANFFLYSDMSLPRHSSVCECTVVVFLSCLLICSSLLCSQDVSCLWYLSPFNVFIFCLATSVHIQQAGFVLLQCAVNMCLFYLAVTHGHLASSLYIY